MEFGNSVPTGYEADANCDYCFEQDHCMVVSGRLDQEGKAGQVGTAVPDEEQEYFTEQYRFIEDERWAVHKEYAKLWEQTAEERAADNRALIDLESAADFYDALDEEVAELLEDAARRADANDRKTVQPRDL